MSTNQFNNDTLPFQQKIVCTKVPFPSDDIYKIIEKVAEIFKNLYGIIILLYGNERISVITSSTVPKKTIETAYRLIEEENIEDTLTIVPFPK